MKFWYILVLLTILIIPISQGYNNIFEFDENEDIVISTTVYNITGQECLGCTCNLTIFNPFPNESIINTSNYMVNNGNGIYSFNVTNVTNLKYNKYIYPLSIVCNNSAGFFGGDSREGIKVGETLFDYTSIMIALVGFGVVLMFASFKIDPQFKELQLLSFFGSFPFFVGAIFTALEIVKMSPNNANFILIFDIMFWTVMALTLSFYYIRFKLLIQNSITSNKTK